MSAGEAGVLGVVTAVAVILGVASLSARTESAQPSALSADGTVNACALLTDKEVASTLQLQVAPADRRDDGNLDDRPGYEGSYSSTCVWRVAEDSGRDSVDLPMAGMRFAILNAITWPKGSGKAKNFLQSFHDAAEHDIIPSKPVPLKGIGDDALWWGDGVASRVGDVSFGVSVFLQNGDKVTQRAMEEALARKIASRL
ncbi:MAG: hypothetical protein AB7E79_02185 [Rhodospirillaceae bacterium]